MSGADPARRNIEIKARVRDPEALKSRVRELADRGPRVLEQEDVFFAASRGRLKLRKFSSGDAELIYYERVDDEGPAESSFIRSDCADPVAVESSLSRAMGVRCVVRKIRTLFWVGRTRIHLDEVEGLGSYMELEVVLEEGESPRQGHRTAIDLMRDLGIGADELVAEAYVDLLLRANRQGPGED